jgi:hypothetical protein
MSMERRCKYRVVHDSLTHLTKSVHLNGGNILACHPLAKFICTHYHHYVRGYLNQHFPQCWIGCMAAEDQAQLR